VVTWTGSEGAEVASRRKPAPRRRSWVLRMHMGGREVEVRLADTTELEAHRYARRLTAEYTLQPL
jgi:hypothetical protein